MEQYTNLASNALASGINSVATSLTLVSATNFPTSGNFRLIIGNELLLCTAISGTTLTVIRGIEGTTAISHATGVVVTHVLTAASLQRIILEYGLQHQPFDPSAFTWVNQGLATYSTDNFGTVLSSPSDGSSWHTRGLRKSRATGNYKVTVGFSVNLGLTQFGMAGIGVYNTSNDKVEYMRIHNDNGDMNFSINRATDFSNSSSSQLTSAVNNVLVTPNQVWFQIEEASTVMYYRISNNGLEWIDLGAAFISTHLIVSDGVFFFLTPYSRAVQARIFHWDEQ